MWEKGRFPRLLQLKIDDELYSELVESADKGKTTVSHIVRSACRKYLEENDA